MQNNSRSILVSAIENNLHAPILPESSGVLTEMRATRRVFLEGSVAALVALAFPQVFFAADEVLPSGAAPAALDFAWFPSRLHAFIWRNWVLVDHARLAMVLGTTQENVAQLGQSMGLPLGQGLSESLRPRAVITVIRANWHLLPYPQLLTLLDFTADQLSYTLREDDFLYVKLGSLKPTVDPLSWHDPTPAEETRAKAIAEVVRKEFPDGALTGKDPLFSFVERLSSPVPGSGNRQKSNAAGQPLRIGTSYFALYGDPFADGPANDPYPDGYLARLAECGVTGIWLQCVLSRLSPLPWGGDDRIPQRREGLKKLATRAATHRMRLFLYLNEPRAILANSPIFKEHPEWRGTTENEYSALCTSNAEVRAALRAAVADVCRVAPDLGGFFTITASENLTNCWSHGRGMMGPNKGCPRCRDRRPAEIMAEVNNTFQLGIDDAGGGQRLLAWDWGWGKDWGWEEDWEPEALAKMSKKIALSSVSEWGLPIERGGVKTTVSEYSLSVAEPGPRSLRNWQAARDLGMPLVAKVQFGNSWEFSSVPYLPAVENVVQHAKLLKKQGISDYILGWTLGGHPSPNLAAVEEVANGGDLQSLATRWHGPEVAKDVMLFWKAVSTAFQNFPFHGSLVYNAPLQLGAANCLWITPTGYNAAMVGLAYDHLAGWRSAYPPEIFMGQLDKVAAGFESALADLRAAVSQPSPRLEEEMRFTEAAAVHFASVANQARYILARDAKDKPAQRAAIAKEIQLATRQHQLQSRDSRIGFEASNQYYYTPLDLVEKVVNCAWAMDAASEK